MEILISILTLVGLAYLIGKELHKDIKYGGSAVLPASGLSATSVATLTNKTYQAPKEVVVALSDGATPALDASLGTVFTLAATGNRTIAVPSNAPGAGLTQTIIIRHTATGAARTLSLNTGAGGFRFGSDITALTETASGKTDYIGCKWDGASWLVLAYTKGY